jgi:hypothetical protein
VLLAARQTEVLGHRVACVLPMIGLLAETAETGSFSSADARALAALAGTDPDTRGTLLLSADLFTTLDAPVPAAVRGRLLRLLDLHGVAVALAALETDPQLSAGALRRTVRAASGLDQLRDRLDVVLRARADGIKAAAALSAVSALAGQGEARERTVIQDVVAAMLAEPQSHQLRLLDAVSSVSSGTAPFPAELADEIVRLGGSAVVAEQLGLPGRSAAELASHALQRARWWRSFAFDATPAQARIAHVVHRAYFLRWQQLCAAGRCAGA